VITNLENIFYSVTLL